VVAIVEEKCHTGRGQQCISDIIYPTSAAVKDSVDLLYYHSQIIVIAITIKKSHTIRLNFFTFVSIDNLQHIP
jgi:hypothetical protein